MVTGVVALEETPVTAVSHRDWRLWKIMKACRYEVIVGEVAGLMVLNSKCTSFAKVFHMCQGKRANAQVSMDTESCRQKRRSRMSYGVVTF